MIQVWGKQKGQSSKKAKGQNTKQMTLSDVIAKGKNQNQDEGKVSTGFPYILTSCLLSVCLL